MSPLAGQIACGVCGGTAWLTREVRPVTVAGRTADVEDEFYRRSKCGEERYLPGMMDAVLRRATARIREQDELLTPDEVRAVRRRYGLTQPRG